MGKTKTSKAINGYISRLPADVQVVLRKVRATIRQAAPDAEEIISYRMPAFRRHRILVYFAAWKNHIGLYPPISGDKAIEKAIARYAGPKGNLQFPLDEPIPYKLIERIVKLRVKQDSAKAAAKARSGSSLSSRSEKLHGLSAAKRMLLNYVVLLKRSLLFSWAVWLSVVFLSNLADGGKAVGLIGAILALCFWQLDSHQRDDCPVWYSQLGECPVVRRRDRLGRACRTAVLVGILHVPRQTIGTQDSVSCVHSLTAFVGGFAYIR